MWPCHKVAHLAGCRNGVGARSESSSTTLLGWVRRIRCTAVAICRERQGGEGAGGGNDGARGEWLGIFVPYSVFPTKNLAATDLTDDAFSSLREGGSAT